MTSTPVLDAMRAVARADFLPADVRHQWADDRALPIGHGATNSQPSTVRTMLELLDVRPGQHILDVGSGSGWTTAILAHLVGPHGSVLGVELIPELVLSSQHVLRAFRNAEIRRARPSVLGAPEDAPFDRVLVSADGGSVPPELVAQLRDGGQMVLPARGRMLMVTRRGAEHTVAEESGRWSFVPLR